MKRLALVALDGIVLVGESQKVLAVTESPRSWWPRLMTI